MRPHGAFKIASRNRAFDEYLDPWMRSERRIQRIVESLRCQILDGTDRVLRVRQVFHTPHEIFRVELEVPEMSYQRVTLLDRDALEELLECEEVRGRISSVIPMEGHA
jgi:hypothetical protein